MVEQRGLLANIGQGVQRGFGRLGDAITGRDQNASDKLAIALMSLSGNPQQTQALQQLAANRIQQRKQNDANNFTVAVLISYLRYGRSNLLVRNSINFCSTKDETRDRRPEIADLGPAACA